jgi:hypothetical protein
VTTTWGQQSRKEISRSVREGLAQHLIGTLLAAKALAGLLAARKAYEAAEADRLVALLKAANKELKALVDELEMR